MTKQRKQKKRKRNRLSLAGCHSQKCSGAETSQVLARTAQKAKKKAIFAFSCATEKANQAGFLRRKRKKENKKRSGEEGWRLLAQEKEKSRGEQKDWKRDKRKRLERRRVEAQLDVSGACAAFFWRSGEKAKEKRRKETSNVLEKLHPDIHPSSVCHQRR